MRRSPELLDVELVDVEVDAADAPSSPPGELWWRPLVAAVPRRVWAAAAAVAVVAAGAVVVADHRQEAALDARLAQVAGLSLPLAEPLAEAWRAPGAGVMTAFDDVMVLWGADTEGGGAVAVDRTDGSVRYTLTGSCQVTSPADGTEVVLGIDSTVVGGRGGDGFLVCVDPGGQPGVPDPFARTTTARVHSLASGEVLRSVPLGVTTSWTLIGADVVSTALDDDRHVTAARWSLETGEPRWSYRGPAPMAVTESPWFSMVSDDVVGIEVTTGWSVSLDAATGAELDRDAAGPDPDGSGTWGPVRTKEGLTLTGRFSEDGTTETTVRGPGGHPELTVRGYVVLPTVDDGTAAGTLFVLRPPDGAEPQSVLSAVDAASGVTRWETDLSIGQVLVLSGHVVVHDAAGTTVLDAVTGETRWARTDGASATHGWDIVTDGRRILTVERERAVSSLVARDVETGTTVWTTPSPVPDAALVQLDDGTVLATGTREAVALRPEDDA